MGAAESAGMIPPSSPIRVLMVLDSYNFGGAENLIAELGRYGPQSLEVSVSSLAPEYSGRTALFNRLSKAGLKPDYV